MASSLLNIGKLFGRNAEVKKAVILTDPEAFDIFNVIPTVSNVRVTVASAMKVPAVAHAVKLIAGKIGDLPAKLYKTGTKETERQHPAFKLIHGEANGWTSAAQLRVDLTIDALLHGNGYAVVNRASDGRPLELLRVDPAKVQFKQEDDGTPFYIVSEERGQVRFEYPDILHIQPIGGVSPIKLHREAIALAISAEKHLATYYANGGRPSVVVMTDKFMTPEGKRNFMSAWHEQHSGDNANGVAILDEKMTAQQLANTFADAQFAENRLEQIREVARAFGIPPTMLFELTRGTWSNTEEMSRQFYTMTLEPWLTAWAWAYARCLLTPEERDRLYIEFVTDDLLTADFAKKATALGQYRSMGALTGNEVRSMLNMPAHPEGDSLANPHITTTPAAPSPTDPEQPEESA
ncbi:phage portal protein [Rhizobium sp. SG_E_25_P2]|uniref:phage portal protein n=1 Tax=Rhizobium sp. SG_E_25_P2 TaxID=2879942 RepID=UPI0024730DAE|nr:phage portal protein [Rhizobium sp. SG_E_25_P2]